jgi:hypothetical protein
LAYSILLDRLKFRKVCVWRVPTELKAWENINRIMGLSLQHLLPYTEGEDMLNRIVIADVSAAPAQLCPSQIPLDQTRDRTLAAAVGSQRLTAWAMARPMIRTCSRSNVMPYFALELDQWFRESQK